MSARVYLFAGHAENRAPLRLVTYWRDADRAPRTIADARACVPTFATLMRDGFPAWLVECESADMGRRIIAARRHLANLLNVPGPCDCGQPDAAPGDKTTSHLEDCASYGRILDSGDAR